MRNIPRNILLIAALLFAPQVLAADLYVSPDGSDSAAGSSADPLRTVAAALEAAVDGDTIYLHDGIYAGGVAITQTNLTLRSVPGEYAVIRTPTSDASSPAVIRIEAGADNVTLDRIDLRGGHEYTVLLRANGASLTNLNLRDGGIELLRAEAGTNFTLAHSTLSNTGLRDPERGVLVASRASDSVLRHNVFIGGYFTGVEITGGGDTAVLEGNYFVGPNLAAITLDPALAQPGDFITNAAPEPYAVDQAVIRNNIFQYLDGAAITLRGSQQAEIINNSVLDFGSDQPVGRIQARDVDGTVVDNDSVTIANNLLTFASTSSRLAWSVASGATGIHDFNDNVYFSDDGNVRFEYEGSSGDLADWQAATGQADRSSETDPVLRHDLHLDASSPLINAGRTAGAPAQDYDGEPRNDGAIDIGADEHSTLDVVSLPPDGRFAGTGVTDGSGEGLFEIRGITHKTGGGGIAPWLLALLLVPLLRLYRRR